MRSTIQKKTLMKNTVIASLFAMASLMVLGNVCAKTRTTQAIREASREAPRQDIWGVEQHGDEIYFRLRKQDMDSDFVVMRSPDIGKGEWQLVRWVMQEGKMTLRTVSGRQHELLPDWTEVAVTAAELPATRAADGSYRIRVTPMFTQAFPSGWGMSQGNHGALAFGMPKVFPKNAVIRTTLKAGKYTAGQQGVRWNFVKLPEKRMAGRRIYGRSAFMHPGFRQSNPFGELSDGSYEVVERWRLEGAESAVAGVEPLAPIVIHVDPATPARWKHWVAAGIESWQPAFEAIGYRRAIRAVVPADADAGDVDYDDVRYSVLCWKTRKRGCEGEVFDPRTGEILQSHVSGQSSALGTYLARYVVALAAVDPRAIEAKLSEEFLGSFVQFVSAHEVGHALGLKDGTFGTFTYTPEQVRDPSWVAANGFTPSIMNYARFNYLAQPEDRMPLNLLLQKPGPADKFWIRLGYGHDSEDVMDRLWNSNPLYRYRRTSSGVIDPYDGIETPGVTDPVAGARLGMLNLERSMDMLGRHTFKETDPEIAALIDARSLHAAALTQWFEMHQQVLSLVGGRLMDAGENSSAEMDPMEPSGRKAGLQAVDAGRQKEAVKFVCESFFSTTPSFLLDGPVAKAAGLDREAAEQLIAKRRESMFQQRLVTQARLSRLNRLNGTFPGQKGDYGIVTFMRDLQGCVVR